MIQISGSASIDSFDSGQGPYAQSKQLGKGIVGVTGNISLNGDVTIYGPIFALNTTIGKCLNGVPGITLSGKAQALGGYIQLSSAPVFPPVPVLPPGTQDLRLTADASLVPGSYGNLTVTGHSTLTLAPGTYSINSIALSGQSVLAVGPAGAVVVNVAANNIATPIDFTGGTISNASGIPANIQLIYGGSSSVVLSGGANSHALLYAPNAAVKLTGGTDWFGAMIVGTLDDSGGVEIHYDRSLAIPPTISAALSPAPDAAGWNNSNVTVSFTCADPILGIASCSPPVQITSEGANQLVSGTAVNRAGFAATTSVSVNLDKTPPAIAAAQNPPPNAAGWNNSNVTVSFTCSDALSGIASCSAPVVVTSDGANQIATGTAVDKAANVTSTMTVVNLDKTPPVIKAIITPVPNAAGWNNSPVTVSFTCSDALSGIDVCPGPVQVATEGANQAISGTARDKAGNTATVAVSVNIDLTPPKISAVIAPAPNQNGWDNAVVTVTFTCSDALSGIDTCPAPVTVSAEGANQPVSGTAKDKAGNPASTTVTINLDLTPPTITAAETPAPNAAGWNNTAATVTFTCADALSGVDTCPAAATVNTEGANQSVSGTALDKAGNSSTKTLVLNVDETPPTITAAVSPAPNAAGWNNSPATVSFTCADALSGIDTCPTVVSITSETSGQTVTGKATDKAGNFASTSATVKLDETPPVLTITSPATGATLNTGPYTVTGTVNDTLSGVASVLCQGTSATVSNSSFSCSVQIAAGPNSLIFQGTDYAGNTISQTVSVQGGFPALLSVTPSTGQQGQQNVMVKLIGQNTHFLQGSTIATFGAGVVASNISVIDPTHLTATLTIAADTATGQRDVTVTTGVEVVTLTAGFTVNSIHIVVNAGPNQTIQQASDVLVTNYTSYNAAAVLRYDTSSGAFIETFIPANPQLHRLVSIQKGPDDNLYIQDDSVPTTQHPSGQFGVLRFDPVTGAFLNQFIPYGLGGLEDAIGPVFGPDGNLYVNEWRDSDQIKRYSGADGTYLGVFASAPPALASAPSESGFTFGPDGNLYVAYPAPVSAVLRYNGLTGAFIDAFVQPGNALLQSGSYVLFHGKYLYIDDWLQARVDRFDAVTGAYVDTFVQPGSGGLNHAGQMGFDPDGFLWVSSGITGSLGAIYRFDGATGAYVDTIIKPQSGGLVNPGGFTFVRSFRTLLHGTASDPTASPNVMLTTVWSEVSGPGAVRFANPNSTDTNVEFPQSGSYVLRLTASDPQGSAISDVMIVVKPALATIASATPDSGIAGRTLTLTIAGQNTHFVQGITTVSLGQDIAVRAVTVTSSGSLRADIVIPATSIGFHAITVTTGSEVASVPTGFSVFGGVPALTSIAPNAGAEGQQNLSVTIAAQNTHFVQGTTQINFGAGISPTAVSVSSPTVLNVVLNIDPAAMLGPRTITVTTGAELASLANGFTVTVPSGPIITTISPSSGQQGQGGPVTIVGQNTHFVQGTTTVSLGSGITVTNVQVTCPTCLSAQVSITAGAGVGPHDVTVTTGSEIAVLTGGFTVLAGTPAIASFGPTSGQQGQAVPITINGQFTHFNQGITQVSLGAGITISNISVSSATSLTARAAIDPAATVGARTLTVTTGSEVVSVPNVFTVQAATPIIFSLNPGGGQQGEINLGVTITGASTHWAQGVTSASFGAGITVVSLAVTSATTAVATVNIAPSAALGARTVTLTTNTEVASFPNGFTVSAPTPVVLSVNPGGAQQGQQSLSVAVTGLGTHWAQGTSQASFGAGVTVVALTVSGPTTATAVVNIDPAAAVGGRTVTVTTGSEVASFPNGFTIIAGTPAITQVNPSTGQAGQQNLSVGITGQFTQWVQGTTTASFGAGITVVSLTVSSPTAATAVINIDASATAGARTLSLTTGSEVDALPNGFTVGVAPTPTLTQVSPSAGQQAQQNLVVTITGQATHFVQGTSQVSFGGAGITVNSVTVASATSLAANISIAANTATGVRPVTVTTGVEVASLPNAFTVNTGTNQAPVITIAPTWSVTLPSSLTLTYTVTDDGLPAGGTLTVSWQTSSGPGTVLFQNQTPTSIQASFSQPGTYVLQITATDTQLTSTQNVTVNVAGNPIPPPTVSITTPVDGTEVTSAVNVVGTVGSASLSSWILEFQPPNASSFQTLATGTTTVSNATLGTFDPTVLVNGIAHIRLTATDTANQTTTTGAISLVLTRNQKIGNFTVSFNDLTVPVAGLPIQVVRTYDSRRRSVVGDFGNGWTLDLKTAQIAESVALGDQWNETHPTGLSQYCIVPAKAHLVTVTLSDGTTYQFQPTLTLQCQSFANILTVTVGFTPVGNTPPNASLAILGNNQPSVIGAVPGPVTLFDDANLTTFDPDQYVLTLPDGRTLQLSLQSGLQKMTDLNGNTVTVSASGITHSTGKGVSFTRDSAQRITAVTDPAGVSISYVYNQLTGDLASVTDRSNLATTFTYSADHGLLTIVDPRGVQPIKNVYDNTGRLIQHIDAFGKVINYTHNLTTRQEVVTDRLGNVTVNNYDLDGNIVQVTDALGGVTQRTYDGRDNLLTETNALGKTRTYTYDSNNNRLTETDPLGNITTYTYNGRNQVLTVTDALGRVTTNTYDANGNLVSTKDAAGNVTSYTYNASGLRTSMTDALGGIINYQYDGSGNLTQQTDPLGHVSTYTYDANGNKLTETKTRTTTAGSEILVTIYQYDASNRLIKTTYPDGTTTQIQYNAIGKQSVTTDQLGRQTTYQYDLMGRLLSTTYPDSTTESSMYDAEGHRMSSTDRNNRTTGYKYDALGRLFETDYPDGATTKTQYDALGQVTAVTDANLNTTQYKYDDAGRRTQVIDALNHTTTFAYDAVGNQTKVTDASLQVTQYQYDALNRRTVVIHPDATTDQTAYDALGRTISKTDQANLTTQYQYDKLGRLTQVTDALGQITSYGYDELGNRISQTDANNHTTRFEYDKLGRRTKRTLPAGQVETMSYDAAGNLKTKVDFNGRTTTYAYDAVNRLTSKTPDATFGAAPVSFTYTNTGQRASMIDASGTTTYSYDLRDRLQQKATPQGTLTYTYDLGGNLTSIHSSNVGGTSVNYTYDALNRLATVKDNRLAAGTTTYAYDPVGNLQSYTYPNSVQTAYQYDSLNRLKNLTIAQGATGLASYAYQLGPAGNRTQVTELGGRTFSYQYDNLYRLTQETIAGAASPAANGVIGYQYDKVANRIQRISTVTAVPAASYSYDADDRLTTDTYDANGNTTASGANTYTYDFENHLTGQNAGAVTIVYDGDGNRVAKTVGAVTTQYLVDDRNLTGYAQVLEEIASGAAQRVYTYGLNRISQSQASGTSFYGYDGHGNVRILTDSTGAVTDRYDYDAFGNIISQAGSTPNVYLYSGEQNDPNLGFYYLRARYLNAGSGRFVTADSFDGLVQDPRSLHRYTYAHNNAVNQADPSGKITLEDTVLAVTIVNILAQIEIVHLAGERFAHANGNLNGASLSLRAGGEGGGFTGDFGFDIDWDFGPNQFCVVPAFDAGISVGSFERTRASASVALGFYAGGNACEKQPLIERIGATTSFPLGIFGSIFSPVPTSYPFLGFVHNLARLSGVGSWSVAIGYTGLQASSTFSSVAVSPMPSYGSAVTYSRDPIPLSADTISTLRSSFGTLADAAVNAINALGSLGRTFTEIEAKAPFVPPLFSPF